MSGLDGVRVLQGVNPRPGGGGQRRDGGAFRRALQQETEPGAGEPGAPTTPAPVRPAARALQPRATAVRKDTQAPPQHVDVIA